MSARLNTLVIGLAILGLVLAGVYFKGRSSGVAAQRQKTEQALSALALSQKELLAVRALSREVADGRTRRDQARKTLDVLVPKLMAGEKAHVPLDPDHALRLRDADRELCRIAPDLDGCA